MKVSGAIFKMNTVYQDPVQYFLNLNQDLISINECLGRTLKFTHLSYQCVGCEKNEKPFRMGFCKKCFFESPMANESILKPELSTAHLGIEQRNLEFEQALELQPHIVYLAYTSELKVGVTRHTQVPTRWVDQGALAALPIAQTDNRYQAGCIEVALKQHLADKTHWKKMLECGEVPEGVFDIKNQLKSFFPEEMNSFFLEESQVWQFQYPIDEPPTKPMSFSSTNLDKSPEIGGKLIGVKGQYLIFQDGKVFNIRSAEGHVIELEID